MKNLKEYMIIKYEEYVTFQRCGINDGIYSVTYDKEDIEELLNYYSNN